MSAIPVNKMLLQELNQLIGIKMLTSDFLAIFASKSNFRGGGFSFSPSADAHESSPPYLFEKRNVLEKISSDPAILDLPYVPV